MSDEPSGDLPLLPPDVAALSRRERLTALGVGSQCILAGAAMIAAAVSFGRPAWVALLATLLIPAGAALCLLALQRLRSRPVLSERGVASGQSLIAGWDDVTAFSFREGELLVDFGKRPLLKRYRTVRFPRRRQAEVERFVRARATGEWR